MNQNLSKLPTRLMNGQSASDLKDLCFRSHAELEIARALEKRDALYIVNSHARFGSKDHRHTQERDFLIFHNGRAGILECDGPHHPRERESWLDHFIMSKYGLFIWREDAVNCRDYAREVVGEFLDHVLPRFG